MTKECKGKKSSLKIFDFDEFIGPLNGAQGALRGTKGLKAAVLVIET